MHRCDGLNRDMNQKDRHTLVEADAVIQRNGWIDRFPPKVGQCANDALNLLCVYADGLTIVIDAENQTPALRQIGKGHEVLSQTIFIGRESDFPIQFIQFMWKRRETFCQHR